MSLNFFSVNTCTSEKGLRKLISNPSLLFLSSCYLCTSHPHHQCMGSGVSEAVSLYPQIIAALSVELSFLLTDYHLLNWGLPTNVTLFNSVMQYSTDIHTLPTLLGTPLHLHIHAVIYACGSSTMHTIMQIQVGFS